MRNLGLVLCAELMVGSFAMLSQASRGLHTASEPRPFGLE